MKWGTPDHPKTSTLAGLLQVELPTAVGLLELLWHWTSKYRPTGSLDGVSDHAVAAACRWSGNPVSFVNALVDARWIDLVPMRRVHGWSEHAENAVHGTLARAAMLFCDGTVPKVGPLDSSERKEAARLLALAKEQYKAAASHTSGEPDPKESPRGSRGTSKEEPRQAVAVALATNGNLSTTTPPTPSGGQRPLAGLIGLVPGRKPAASFENREALRGCIEFLIELSGEGSFSGWCREVTARKVRGRVDYSQARVSLDGISEDHAARSLIDARAEVARIQKAKGITDVELHEMAERLRRPA